MTDKWNKVYELVESLLPWLNFDLWKKIEEQKTSQAETRENADFATLAKQAGFDPSQLDELRSSDTVVQPRSIKDLLQSKIPGGNVSGTQ